MIYHIFVLFLIAGEHDHFSLEGLMKSPPVDDSGNCLPPLLLNATSVIRIDVDYNKAVYYTLMVAFVSFINNEYS
jgi:hypothetical protein